MNILVLTSIYPQEDDENNSGVTPVVKYFAEEWVKEGHNVTVIHNSTKYPKLLYLLPPSIIKKVNSRFGIVLPNINQSRKLSNVRNGVSCFRLPMLKLFPKSGFSEKQIEKQAKDIQILLKEMNFYPDLIVGHWENPQIPLLAKLKKIFKTKTSIVFHNLVYIKQKSYLKKITNSMNEIDVIGARSKSIALEVSEILNLDGNPFICYSGIPDKYFKENFYQKHSYSNKTPNTFLYVGRLIRRKNIDVSIETLSKIYGSSNFEFNIIGDGAEKEGLIELSRNLKTDNNISFMGYKMRDEIMKVMGNTEVFIMISNNETFGLVYIEAMSQGCIVIASKDGGMDGIILHGENGFLCTQGDAEELEEIIEYINDMSTSQKKQISQEAYKTSLKFKDSKIAQDYLHNVIN